VLPDKLLKYSAGTSPDLKVRKGGLPPLPRPSDHFDYLSDLLGQVAGQATLPDLEIGEGACKVFGNWCLQGSALD
jgi:hypothetical protein